MNDLLNNNTKPKNIEELYQQILEIYQQILEIVPIRTNCHKII